MSRRHGFWPILLATGIGGCAQPADFGDAGTDAHGGALGEARVVSQLCVPDEVVRFDDVEVPLAGIAPARSMRDTLVANGYAEPELRTAAEPLTEVRPGNDRTIVRKWRPEGDDVNATPPLLGIGEALSRDGVFSEGMGGVQVWGNSSADQPIFEIQGHRPQDTLAVMVSRTEGGKSITYWYLPPRRFPDGAYTPWLAPVLREDGEDASGRLWRQSAFQQLMRGEKIEPRPVPDDAPRIRFRRSTEEEYADQYRFWTRDVAAINKQFFSGPPRSDAQRLHFAPKLRAAIPAC